MIGGVGCSTAPTGPPPGVALDLGAGLGLLRSSCHSCHGMETALDTALAPAWSEVAAAYDGAEAELVQFLAHPERAVPRMGDAVAQFGPMPNMGLTPKQAQEVAAFLLHTDLNRTGWSEVKGAVEAAVTPLELAGNWARATKGVLGKNLMRALAEGGPEHAVPFCNERAIELTDSMSGVLHARIRRVSDRPRNAANRAEGEAAAYLARQHERGQWTPELLTTAAGHTAFLPITTNDMCLQCHGTAGDQVGESTLRLIAERYPDDEATGYAANELRGAWVVEFDANPSEEQQPH